MPFFEDQLEVLKVSIPKPIRRVEKKPVIPERDTSMDTEMEKAAATVSDIEIIPEEFPTISDTYGQLGKQDNINSEENCI